MGGGGRKITPHPPRLRFKDSKIWIYGPERSNQFIKPDESKVNIDDRVLKYNFIKYGTKSNRKLSKNYI